MLFQKLHLIDQDAAVRQDQKFGAVRHVRRVHELHRGFFGQARTLALVTGATRCDDIHPRIKPCARVGDDVIAG